jgi:hypothetical protein
MNKKEEFLQSLPKEPSKQEAEQWVMSVLAVTPISEVAIENSGHDKKVNLPLLEIELFREMLKQFGKPGILPKENRLVGDPNPSNISLGFE